MPATIGEKAKQSIRDNEKKRQLKDRAKQISAIMKNKKCSVLEACNIHEAWLQEKFGQVPESIAEQLKLLREGHADWTERLANASH